MTPKKKSEGFCMSLTPAEVASGTELLARFIELKFDHKYLRWLDKQGRLAGFQPRSDLNHVRLVEIAIGEKGVEWQDAYNKNIEVPINSKVMANSREYAIIGRDFGYLHDNDKRRKFLYKTAPPEARFRACVETVREMGK